MRWSIVNMSSIATPVERIIKFPAAAIRSIKNKAESKVLQIVWRVNSELPVMFLSTASAAQNFTQPITARARRIVRGLYHQSPDVTVKPHRP